MPGNVPAELSSFVGRDQLLADLTRQLGDVSSGRLLTLTGAGGSGKTRVALQAARSMAERFEDGAWFVGLAPISNPSLVMRTVAQTLGVRDASGAAPLQSLGQYLRERQLLLVLDNFEQVLSAASEVSELLGICPRLRLLVTSRAALRVSGERELAVLPLEPSESARLFTERATAVKADFAPTDELTPVIDEICRRLDGLPLAIELAAARVRFLDPPAMLKRLEYRLQFLTSGAVDLPARQRTLRDTIAWSYDLLDPDEQAVFRCVAVFVGGASLDAVQAVFPHDKNVLDHIDSLVAKSLLRAVTSAPGEVRLMPLETTRDFGLEQLASTDELEPLRQRHAEYCLSLAEHAEPRLWGPSEAVWLERLAAEHDNFRAALDWALGSGTPHHVELALRLAGALGRFWWTRSHFGEGRQWLSRALAAGTMRSAPRMKALHAAGWLSHFLHDSADARVLLEESLSIARELDDQWTTAWVLHVLGRVAYFESDHVTARALADQALAIAAHSGSVPDCLGDASAGLGGTPQARLCRRGRAVPAQF
jgi:predicted ATPase